MDTASFVPLLALVTLGLVLLVAVVQAVRFFGKRRNREADKTVDMGRRPIDRSAKL